MPEINPIMTQRILYRMLKGCERWLDGQLQTRLGNCQVLGQITGSGDLWMIEITVKHRPPEDGE
jgi:hypothetical protein